MVGQKEGNIKYTNDIIKSPEDKRLYRALELSNKLQILLISDSTTDKSAACLGVNVGSLSDPDDAQGLAHFCEHMLFLGTEKYPCENEYEKFLSEHGGCNNATTSASRTNYFFDVKPEYLEGALDRFAQFFISPLFTESAVDREVNAVHSEHERNIADDYWRLYQLEKHTSRKDHPFSRFGTGNRKSLKEEPKEKGIDVREELLKFHKKWYSSNIMSLAVLGKESLEELENMVVPLFSNVENKNVEILEWNEHPLGPDELQMIRYVVPVKDIRLLHIEFATPDLNAYYKSDPLCYIKRLIGHKGPGSLLSSLKAKGWCNWLSAKGSKRIKGFSVFNMCADLTEEGIEHVNDIVALIFQYLEMLRQSGPQEWLFQENKKLLEIDFRFKDKENPMRYVVDLVEDLLNCTRYSIPVEEVLSMPYSLSQWAPDVIEMVLNYLKPSNSRIAVIGQKFESIAAETEPWYGIKFKLEEISKENIEKWENCGLCDVLKLPSFNEFIPSNFDISFDGLKENVLPHPTMIQRSAFTRVWFKQDDQFLLPKANLMFELISPLVHLDPLNCILNSTFVRLIRDALEEYLYAAEIAGLSWKIEPTEFGIRLNLNGYNDKQKLLLDNVLEKMTTFEVDPQRFAILKEAYVRNLKNYKMKQPNYQAWDHLLLLISERNWTVYEKLEATSELTLENMIDFIPRFLSKLHVECLFHGNVNEEQAFSLLQVVENRLNANRSVKPLLPSQLLKHRGIQLDDGSNFVYEFSNKYHKSSCTVIYYQLFPSSVQNDAIANLLVQILKEPCFDTLRTKEQLGYIVWTLLQGSNSVLGLQILVQSDRHPSYVDQRIEAFLSRIRQQIEIMTDHDFEKHKEGLTTLLLEKPKRLSVLTRRFWNEISSQRYHFNVREDEVDYLRTISKKQFVQFFDDYVKYDAPNRRKLLVRVLSEAEGGAGTSPLPKPETLSSAIEGLGKPPPYIAPKTIKDITKFKRSQKLYPLAEQFMNID